MIEPQQLVVGVISGCLLVVVGLAPRLFHALAEGVRNASHELRGSQAMLDYRRSLDEVADPPTGLAIVGALVVALTIVAYLSK